MHGKPDVIGTKPISPTGGSGENGGGGNYSSAARLGAGGVAGIVIGIFVFVAGLVICSIWAYGRPRHGSKQSRPKTPHLEDNSNDTGHVKSELDSTEQA